MASAVGESDAARAPPLHEIHDALKRQLGLEGTFEEVINAACPQLGVPPTGSLHAKGNACWRAMEKPVMEEVVTGEIVGAETVPEPEGRQSEQQSRDRLSLENGRRGDVRGGGVARQEMDRGGDWDKRARRWKAYYKDADGKKRTIGLFDTQEQAAHAVNAAIRRADLEGRRKTNPVVDGQLVPRGSMSPDLLNGCWFASMCPIPLVWAIYHNQKVTDDRVRGEQASVGIARRPQRHEQFPRRQRLRLLFGHPDPLR